MPIKRRSDRRRLSRVGKIHLGVKSDKGVPRAVDYFVVKPDASTSEEADAAFKAVYGDEPRELSIMFPTDDPEQWSDQWYKLYSQSWGLICRGNGETAWARWDPDHDGPRPVGVESGTWANHRSEGWTSREVPCAGPECPMQAEQGLCRQVMNLQFLLPDVRGIGVWQIDTGSFNSIMNIEDNVETIKAVTGGRIRGLPLKLRMSQKEVVPPGGKKKKVWVLDLTLPDVSLADLLATTASLPAVGGAIMLPPPSEEDEADVFDPVNLIDEFEGQVSVGVRESAKVGISVAGTRNTCGQTANDDKARGAVPRGSDQPRAEAVISRVAGPGPVTMVQAEDPGMSIESRVAGPIPGVPLTSGAAREAGLTAAEVGARLAAVHEGVTAEGHRAAFLARKPENVGDLLTWSFQEFHLKPPQVDEILKCDATKLQANEWQRAWVTVVNHVLGAQVPFE